MLVKNINYINSIEGFPSDYYLDISKIKTNWHYKPESLALAKDIKLVTVIYKNNEKPTTDYDLKDEFYTDGSNIHSSIIRDILEQIDLQLEIEIIDSNLNGGMRYFNVVKNRLLELSKPDIIASLKELALEEDPVYENNIGIKVNNYGLCEKYLLLDDTNCENHSQVINDCQIEQLLQLQIVLEELNIKEKLMFENVDIPFDVISYCIPGYFRVKGE